MELKKKDVKKIKKATQEELGKLHEEYKAATKNVSGMSPIGLLAIAIAGIVVIFLFQNKLLILIGLVMLLYPIYVFIRRGAHRAGYFEGYYDLMTKLGSRDEYVDSKKPEKPE
jgi:multisubunit Na+/H+ antiporter MnhG subunit